MTEYKPKIANKYNSLVNEYIKPTTDNEDTKVTTPYSSTNIQLKVKADKNISSRNKTISRRNRNYNNMSTRYCEE